MTRPASFAELMSDATVMNDASKALTVVAERLKELLDDASARALVSDYPVPATKARQFAATIQNTLVLAAIVTSGVTPMDLEIDVFAAQNGGVILTVDHREKRLTFRVDPGGRSASVSEIGPDGFQDRVRVDGAQGILPLFHWLVRAA